MDPDVDPVPRAQTNLRPVAIPVVSSRLFDNLIPFVVSLGPLLVPLETVSADVQKCTKILRKIGGPWITTTTVQWSSQLKTSQNAYLKHAYLRWPSQSMRRLKGKSGPGQIQVTLPD